MDDRKSIIVVGGGLAGLSAAAALGTAGHKVTVLEARQHLGGRATSYPLNTAEEAGATIDNCQHVLLRCCHNLIDFYRRLGVAERIQFHKEFYWIEPGGRTSVMQRGWLPAPLHFSGSFARLRFLSLADKIAIANAILAVRYEFGKRANLDSMTMLQWLQEKGQTPRAISRFWTQVLVSAVNEELDKMSALHGLQVFALGFLSKADAYEMGVPAVPLADLYSRKVWSRFDDVTVVERTPVERLEMENGRVKGLVATNGIRYEADAYLAAVPFEKLAAIVPELQVDLSAFSHAPITGIHLWFDRPVTDLPHATLLDRTIQWMFNKKDGKHIQLVVSASRLLTPMAKNEVVELALRELAEFFPAVAGAKLERSHVVKEVRATFSAAPNLEQHRPSQKTSIANLFLAGDWTKSGWPSTMEGAVRSGYLAAEAALQYLGTPAHFLLADVA